MGQAAALSRGSITAIGAEALLALEVNASRGGSLRQAHRAWSVTRNGYDPEVNVQHFLDYEPFKLYRLAKHGGQIVRKVRTRSAQRGGVISRLLEPVGEYILRPVGLTSCDHGRTVLQKAKGDDERGGEHPDSREPRHGREHGGRGPGAERGLEDHADPGVG